MMPTPKEFIAAGVHVGHSKSRWNPQMEPFVFGVRNNFHIIDVFKTIEQLEKVIEFLKSVRLSGNRILFVGTKVQTRSIVKEVAESLKEPYVAGRWIGGLFTNFSVVKKRINHFLDLESKVSSGEIEKYTKREQLSIKRQLAKFQEEFGGIKNMEKIPGALFVSDVHAEETAIKEAQALNVPIIAIVDTDGNPNQVDYPIPANDSAISSLKLIYSTIKKELERVLITEKKEEEKAQPTN